METLVNITELNPVTLFDQDAIVMTKVIQKIRSHVNFAVLDPTTEKGRKEIASLAYKVTRSKTALDDCGKDYVSEIKAKSKVIDKVRSNMRKELEALSDKVRKPLTDFEDAEKIKAKAIQDKLAQLDQFSFDADDSNIEELKALQEKVFNFKIDESFGNMQETAIKMKESTYNEISEQIKKEEQLAKDQAELAELREEKRLKLEKEEKEAAEKLIKDRATKEAEEKAEKEKKDQAEKVEKEKKEEQEKKDQITREKIAAEEKLKNEILRTEKAEADKIEAAKQAKIEKEEAIRATELRVKKEQEEAKEREIAEEKKREANISHHKKINNQTLQDILKIGGVHEYNAKEIIKEIALGNIRNLSIKY